MRRIWRVRDPDPAVQQSLASSLNISSITAQLLLNRGVEDAEGASRFMTCSLS